MIEKVEFYDNDMDLLTYGSIYTYINYIFNLISICVFISI